MDRFSEQLLTKIPSGKDMFLRGLIIAGEMVIIALLVIVTLLFQFSIIPLTFFLLVGSFFLVKFLFEMTMIEYEYIVTNDDLDIDKIIGRRKRKRLVTVSLKTVTELAEYDGSSEISADVSVIAHDNSGEELWYIIADDERYGALAVVFNPNARTRDNMIGGFETKTRLKYAHMITSEGEALENEPENEPEESEEPDKAGGITDSVTDGDDTD